MLRTNKIVLFDQIRKVVQAHQDKGLRVVQCSGVFNITHYGHLEYFDFARGLGDILVVSVNSDRALKSLRGKNYHWISQEARCRMLAALDVIDHIVVFDDTDAANIIKAVQPDIFVKGADYRHRLPQDEIQALSECGSELVFKDLVKDRGDKASASDLARSEGLLLRNYVERFSTLQLLVIGDYALDVYSYGTVQRMSREAPVPILTRDIQATSDSVLGQAGNCALNIASLGAQVTPVGILGRDSTAVEVTALLREYDIDTAGFMTVEGYTTPRKERVFAHNANAPSQQIVRIDDGETAHLSSREHQQIIKTVCESMDECDGIVFSDYGYGVCTPIVVQGIIEEAQIRNKFVIADSRYCIGLYRGIAAVMPSETEVTPFLNQNITDLNVNEVVSSLRDELSLDYAVITRGSKGMILADGKQILTFQGKKDVVDATGAGDTALALFALSLLSGASAQEAAQLSTTGVAITLMKKGTCLITRDELAARLQIGLV